MVLYVGVEIHRKSTNTSDGEQGEEVPRSLGPGHSMTLGGLTTPPSWLAPSALSLACQPPRPLHRISPPHLDPI